MNIINELHEMLHHIHAYLSIFKYALENIELTDHKVTVRVNPRTGADTL